MDRADAAQALGFAALTVITFATVYYLSGF